MSIATLVAWGRQGCSSGKSGAELAAIMRLAPVMSRSLLPQPAVRAVATMTGLHRLAFHPHASRSATTINVSPRRLEEFLEAEVHAMAKLGYKTIKIEQILASRTPEVVARIILKELPARFATRVQQIQTTTPNWSKLKGIKEVHDMLFTSFKNLRMVDLHKGWKLSDFTEVIKDLRARHKPVVPLLSEAANSLKEHDVMDDKRIDEWLMKFMNSRIGTEMLTAHYMQLLTPKDESHVGIVDTRCRPAKICGDVIDHVKRHFKNTKQVDLQLRVEHPEIEFSFIDTYLFFIIEELLKNSIIATIRNLERNPGAKNVVRITVCADPGRVGIKISDRGGGVPFELSDRIWDCGYTTTPEDMQNHFQERTPVSGPGFGLPLCRLYCKYLGGSFDLMSMPGVGTDVYMFFDRLDANEIFHSTAHV